MPASDPSAPVRYRIWDGARLWTPDDLAREDSLVLFGSGLVGRLLDPPSDDPDAPRIRLLPDASATLSLGLHDIRGVEIFVGDRLLNSYNGRRYTVHLGLHPADGKTTFGFYGQPLLGTGSPYLFSAEEPYLRVVGNVFENSDESPDEAPNGVAG